MGRRRKYDTQEVMLPDANAWPEEAAHDATAVHNISSMLEQIQSQTADQWTLTIVNGVRSGYIATITDEMTVLGRGPQSDLVIDDPGLSRRHASLVRRGQRLLIRDLDSTNGTYVGTEAVEDDRPLSDGETVRLANTLVRVQLRTAAEVQAMLSLYESSVRDPLTKLFNRRYLDERLQSELAYAIRHRTTLSVMLIDLDHFKEVNDTYGHLAGDEILRQIAIFLQQAVRQEDLVARYGGEEMIVVLRAIGARGAEIMAHRVRQGIESMRIGFDGEAISVTASIGVATWAPERPYTSVDGVVAAADECLYRAKSAGRNLVICDASPRSSPPV